jgi:hypothetical protein
MWPLFSEYKKECLLCYYFVINVITFVSAATDHYAEQIPVQVNRISAVTGNLKVRETKLLFRWCGGLFCLRRSQLNLERTGHTVTPEHAKTPSAAETHHSTTGKQ